MGGMKTVGCDADAGETIRAQIRDAVRANDPGCPGFDSVPYLFEHERPGEPWVYEAIPGCYPDVIRRGKED